MALFMHLLMIANDSEERGSVEDLSIEDAASAMDCDEDQIVAILDAMQGRVIENGRLSGWEKRQPARNDDGNDKTGAMSAAERKRNQREREKSSKNHSEVTTCHDVSREVTTCHAPEAEAEADVNPNPQAAAIPETESRATASVAAACDPVTTRSIEIAALLRPRGVALQASNPTVRAWAGRGITDGQLLTAAEVANERRAERADHRPINAGFLDAILADFAGPQNARASPAKRQTIHEKRAETIAALTGKNRNHERQTTEPRDITAESVRIA